MGYTCPNGGWVRVVVVLLLVVVVMVVVTVKTVVVVVVVEVTSLDYDVLFICSGTTKSSIPSTRMINSVTMLGCAIRSHSNV